MPKLLSILFSALLLGSAAEAWACSPPEGLSIQAAANIRISYPADGAVVSATSLDVLLVLEGDGEAQEGLLQDRFRRLLEEIGFHQPVGRARDLERGDREGERLVPDLYGLRARLCLVGRDLE